MHIHSQLLYTKHSYTMERVNKWFEGELKSTHLPPAKAFADFAIVAPSRRVWPPAYQPSWYYFQQHQANHWYATEHDPLDDAATFVDIEAGWQSALLQSFAALAVGDDQVMALINENNLDWAESTRWLFADQNAREATHKIVYNRMLELARGSATLFTVDTLTNEHYAAFLMQGVDTKCFTHLLAAAPIEHADVLEKAAFLMFMIMCERYMFAAPFLIINLMGESGLINTCVKINMQVMKDEHVHYLHAVQLLHDLKTAVSHEANSLIDSLFTIVVSMYQKTVETMVVNICFDLPDTRTRRIMDHTRFTLRTIHEDCGFPVPSDLKEYDSTSFAVFDKNTGADKFNLMESNSTVYKAGRSGVYVPDWSILTEPWSILTEPEPEQRKRPAEDDVSMSPKRLCV